MNSLPGNQLRTTPLGPMNEPVTETMKKECKIIGSKLKYVLWPFGKENNPALLQEWDMWGPLIILLSLTAILTVEHGVKKSNEIFGAIYFLYFGGAFVVSTNALLVRSDGSIGLMSSVLGYSTAPF